MLMLIAFALFALLIAAWIVAPSAAPERRGLETPSHATLPELRTHAA